MSTVLLEKITNDGRIALLTVNRPEVLNALNDAVMAELEADVDKLERDETVKALIITGAGERSFVAGADLAEFAARSTAEHYPVRMSDHALLSRIETVDKATVPGGGGRAPGGGWALWWKPRPSTPT